jgi:hypothetical protein
MKTRTALELVDELLERWDGGGMYERMKSIKSAIELEQAASASIFARKETEILFHHKAIKELNLKLSDLEKSAITMRPISELPDRVPDGCVIVAFSDDNTVFIWEKRRIREIAEKNKLTSFYILPLPVKERKLRPCPFCGAVPDKHQHYWVVKHNDTCAFEGTTTIRPVKEDTWG